MEIYIRETREDDFRSIKRLIVSENMVDSARFTEDKFRKMLTKNKGFCFVAEIELTDENYFSINYDLFFKKH